jgi:hypothetical protein
MLAISRYRRGCIKSDLFADVFRMITALQQNLIQGLREALGCRAFEPD